MMSLRWKGERTGNDKTGRGRGECSTGHVGSVEGEGVEEAVEGMGPGQ